MARTQQVKIAARIRPLIGTEADDEGVRCVRDEGGHVICVNNPRDPSQVFRFPFTSCYDKDSTQDEIFANDVEPMLDSVYEGMTVTIFAYGVTSSGKTHTMQGTKAEPGIIPRTVQSLFNRKRADLPRNASLEVSYMEIYKDEVYDLMVNRDNAPKLPVRENEHGQVFVANLTAIPVDTLEEFDSLYTGAMKRRSVASTNFNRASSRSHAILTMIVKVQDPTSNRTLMGKLNLVDLAGSENNKHTGNDASRMAESSAINKSLSVLGQVVHALNQGASRIPYRNSKLTRLLQDALGGSSIGLLICNIAPAAKFRQDTLNTLNFAVRTKNIENKLVVNERAEPPRRQAPFTSLQPGAPKPGPAPRQSLIHNPNSRVPRPSIGNGAGGSGIRPPSIIGSSSLIPPKVGITLTEQEIDERIAKAVEAEVARRLESERLKLQAEAQVAAEAEAERIRIQEAKMVEDSSPTSDSANVQYDIAPSCAEGGGTGVDSISQRSDHFDDELRQRLQVVEHKLESNNEMRILQEMSPVSRKKQGRAYVALARAQSEKNNLQLALELYRKAEAYVPDNIKLKERIIEIEWAVKNNKPFQPSPKRAKKKQHGSKKSKKSSSSSSKVPSTSNATNIPTASTSQDTIGGGTNSNVDSLDLNFSSSKRSFSQGGPADDNGTMTPRKHKRSKLSDVGHRQNGGGIEEVEEDDEEMEVLEELQMAPVKHR
ncbi:P-loop containing nucleoside triphosphate hydrolase protein [Abortiporus biennis]|nr:P-loop containing nucleoside triphosphate hydrolase protein [Abortiporus biennis]